MIARFKEIQTDNRKELKRLIVKSDIDVNLRKDIKMDFAFRKKSF